MKEALGPDNIPNSEADTQNLKVRSETRHLYFVHNRNVAGEWNHITKESEGIQPDRISWTHLTV